MKIFWNLIKTIGDHLQSPFLFLIRLYWGFQFALAGFGKFLNLSNVTGFFQNLGIPFPFANAIITGSIEFLGGLLLIVGLFSRIAALPLLIVMIVALSTAHHEALFSLFEDPDPFFQASAFLFGLAALLVFCFGPGKFSLDYWVTGAYRNREMP